jgi:threonine dehydrogenase-like Zn-dependent dehydrogenase
MKAVCWHGAKDVRVDTVPEPKILNPRDAILKVTSTTICGSDLHIYSGYIPSMQKGDIIGHEFMGEIVEVGPQVKKLKVGDRVANGKVDPSQVFTHTMPLEETKHAFELFKHKRDNCIKVLLKP